MKRLLLFAPLVLTACGPNSNMVQQPKYQDEETSSLFANGVVEQPPVEGTVARGTAAFEREAATPPPLSDQLLARGQERYAIYCAPCHGAGGDGDGMVVRRGFPAPPSLHEARLRAAPTGYMVKVMSAGYGTMYPFRARIAPADRWAIEAYIRALQLSRNVEAASLPDELRERLP
jgi:mono/diheme cytochrome c family protein